MRFFIVIAFCSFLSLEGLAQERGFLVGGSLGLNALGTWNKSENMMDTQPKLGWSGSAVVVYNMKKPFRLTGQLGGVVEKQREVSRTFFTDGVSVGSSSTDDFKFSWGEATALFSYMPIRKQVFGLSIGTGFSTRRLISAWGQTEVNHSYSGAGSSGGEYDLADLMNKWSYLLPFQLDVSFDLAESGTVMITAEYQLGLRNKFNNTYRSDMEAVMDYSWVVNNEKFHSLSIKLAYLFGI